MIRIIAIVALVAFIGGAWMQEEYLARHGLSSR